MKTVKDILPARLIKLFPTFVRSNSPQSDPTGFAPVLDDHTLAIPDRPGNRIADTCLTFGVHSTRTPASRGTIRSRLLP